jgi:uncharacterized protein (DUF1330 family)
MTVYAIAQLKFKDRERYRRYQERFMDVLKQFNGRLLVADEHPTVIEGSWDRDKLVVISFADETGLRAWSESTQYQEIAKDRKAGVDAVVILAKGVQ